VTRRAGAVLGGAALAALLATLPVALAQEQDTESQSPQAFFREKLLNDRATSRGIRVLLRNRDAFVDRSITFRDLTGDDRVDAVVRVQSGGAGGAIGVYVFSTAGRSAGSELRAVFRSQDLLRASTSVRRNVLTYTYWRYGPGDEVCCPGSGVETTLQWDRSKRQFRASARRELGPVSATPTPTPTPAP